MQSFKTTFAFLLAIVIVGALGYWAINTIEPGNIHAEREKQKELQDKNESLQKELEVLKQELALLKPKEPAPEEVKGEEKKEEPKPSAPSKHQTLINELEKLVADKIAMKEGSRGSRVGTLQNFLNIYFNTSKRIDNDYGKGTKADVANFQKAVGVSADGEAGPSTFQKMIDWLKTNS